MGTACHEMYIASKSMEHEVGNPYKNNREYVIGWKLGFSTRDSNDGGSCLEHYSVRYEASILVTLGSKGWLQWLASKVREGRKAIFDMRLAVTEFFSSFLFLFLCWLLSPEINTRCIYR